jgi:tRNA pseudouridine38-40 synthase
MPTVRLIVRYDGTGLSGWQRQRGVATVQEHLEIAASVIACEPIIMRASGRTDAGVHARAQVVSFRTRATIPEKGWRLGLTSKLPPQIAVLDARVAHDDFDPRRASAGKRYRYLLLATPVRDPLLRERVWHLWDDLDLKLMQHEADALVGMHDFNAFRAADCDRVSAVRHIWRVAVLPRWHGHEGLVAIEVEGTAFLKNMVRIITGTLVDVGRARLPAGTVRARLADGDRTRSGITAPPQGLYLDEVFLKPEWLLPDDVLKPRPAYAEAVLGHSLAPAHAPAPTPRHDLDEDDE